MMNRAKIHKSLYLLFSIAIVISLPFSLKVCSWSIGLLTANWLIEADFKRKFEIAKHSILIKLVVAFALVSVLSLLYSTNLEHGLFVIEVKMALFILPVVIGTMPTFSKRDISLILGGFVLSCSIAAILSITWAGIDAPKADSILVNFDHTTASKYDAMFHYKSDKWLLFSYIGLGKYLNLHPTYFSLYLLFSFIIILYAFRYFRKLQFAAKTLLTVVALLLLISIVLLSSRIVIACLALFITVAIVYFLRTNRQNLKGAMMCISFLAVFVVLVYFNPVTQYRLLKEPFTMENYSNDNPDLNSVSLRLLEWKASSNVILKNPLLGVGIGDVQDELDVEYGTMADINHFAFNLNSHNQYLQTAVTTGLVGLILFLGILFYPLKISYSKMNWLHVTFILILSICFLTESMLQVQKGIAFFSFFHPLLFFHPLTTQENG